jgi:hypothetical protein
VGHQSLARNLFKDSFHRTETNMPQPPIPPKTLTRVPDFSPEVRLILTVHHTTLLKIENTTEANEETAL